MSNERTHRVAVIGGDGIGPEVTAAALEVVRAAGVSLATTPYDLGAARYLKDGFVLDDATLEELRGYDAIMLGAVGPAIGDTRIPGGVLERGLLLRMRFGLDLYINYRPFRGVAGSLAEGCSFAIVRENTEGPYAGEGGHTAARDAPGGRDPGFGQHALRRRALRALRLRAGLGPRRATTDAGPQDQRAHLRRRPLVARRHRGGGGVRGRHRRLQPRRRRVHLPRRESPALRRHRDRQPVRRHPLGPGRCGHRRHRLRGERQLEPRAHRRLAVRAGPRRGARHRRHGEGQSAGRGLLGGTDARAPR